ncbi:putative papain-like cysteine peptidase superfamily [Helianthus annuus]|nr:putative papain-like cysteine peptidase superfamily [Helianthus annuus]
MGPACTPYCMCYAAAQMVTILYRMHRQEECKSLILSPQTLLNLGCQYVDRLRVFLTESEYGLYDIEVQPFLYLRTKKPESLAKSDKPYLIKDLAIYRTKETILKALISNFREGGPQYPMLGACNMHGLTSAKAADTTPEKPFIRKEPRLKKNYPLDHSVLITGIYVASVNPTPVNVQLRNSWGD